MTEFTTENYFIACVKCNSNVNYFYLELGISGKICEKCLIDHNNGEFPKGKDAFYPCKKCIIPNIKWSNKESYNCKISDYFNDDYMNCKDHKNKNFININDLFD